MTGAEACRRLGVSPRTLRRWAAEGYIRTYMRKATLDQTRSLVVDEQSVADWLSLLTPEQAARRLGVERKTLHSYSRKGLIHPIKFGGKTRFRPEDIETWLPTI